MTHLSCVNCRLHFPPPADEPAPCPICGSERFQLDAESVIGFQLHRPVVSESLMAAIAVHLPTPR